MNVDEIREYAEILYLQQVTLLRRFRAERDAAGLPTPSFEPGILLYVGAYHVCRTRFAAAVAS